MEELLKQLLMQRSQQTLAQAAADDAAFHQQRAARTKPVVIPTGGGMSEAEARRQYQLQQNEDLTEDALHRRAARIATGMGSVRENATTDPTVMANVLGRAGTMMYNLGERDRLAALAQDRAAQFQRDRLVHPDEVTVEDVKAAAGADPSLQLPTYQPGAVQWVPRTDPQTQGRMMVGEQAPQDDRARGELLDQIVRSQGYFPEMFAGTGQEAIRDLGLQLDARRRAVMGDWDPSLMGPRI